MRNGSCDGYVSFLQMARYDSYDSCRQVSLP